jgi:hypothetical protein
MHLLLPITSDPTQEFTTQSNTKPTDESAEPQIAEIQPLQSYTQHSLPENTTANLTSRHTTLKSPRIFVYRPRQQNRLSTKTILCQLTRKTIRPYTPDSTNKSKRLKT